jgi:hypothetical protein
MHSKRYILASRQRKVFSRKDGGVLGGGGQLLGAFLEAIQKIVVSNRYQVDFKLLYSK